MYIIYISFTIHECTVTFTAWINVFTSVSNSAFYSLISLKSHSYSIAYYPYTISMTSPFTLLLHNTAMQQATTRILKCYLHYSYRLDLHDRLQIKITYLNMMICSWFEWGMCAETIYLLYILFWCILIWQCVTYKHIFFANHSFFTSLDMT
jgi:hypothetical protein